nr:bacterio-opsin activator domain-containing protein [Halostella salina]
MNPNGDGRSDAAFRVVTAGPPAWQSRVEAAIDRLPAVDRTTYTAIDTACGAVRTGETPDCVISAAAFDGEGDGELSDLTAAVPEAATLVLAPLSGTDLSVGTDAASWVVPLDGDLPGTTGVDGLETVLSCVRERGRAARDAGAFRGAFDDPDRFVAVLDRDGTIRRINDAAAKRLEALEGTVAGKRFWALPWRGGRTVRREVQDAVTRAGEGSYTTFEGALACADEAAEGSTLEFRVQPAGDDPDTLLVQGEDRAEREQLEAELRSSEELHRVTLNNMTDTVLVTNDEGEFTYVCPNVHFIFGYTAEEIHEFGTIDELLGADPADPDRLAEEGVVTNVEHAATDKDGDEHTLLVNVRNVSIQDGTRLYSCRDITKRKQRERALTGVQRTSRELLYAETRTEVATQVVSSATETLTSGGAAVYGFDDDENVLYPITASDSVRATVGSLPDVSLDQRTAISNAFVEERTTDRTDAGGSGPALAFDSLDDLSAIPLGEHGVLLLGTTDGGPLSDVDREIGELLAATAEAAFDRLERERELRERDATLRERNRRLTETNRVNEMIREIDQALVHAETREEMVEAVCDRLTSDERFAFAWIGEVTAHGQRVRPSEWAGDNREYLDAVSLSTTDRETLPEPAVRTSQDRSMTVVQNVADSIRGANWCKEAVSRNFDSVLSVPLSYDGVLFGTLTVYGDEPNAFSETVQAVFRELGDTIGAAINSLQRKEALRSDSVFRLTYRIDDPATLLRRIAERVGCTLELKSEVTRADGSTLVFVAVDGADPRAVADAAADLVDVIDAELIRADDDGGLVSFTVRDQFLSAALASHGATRRTVEATPEQLRLVVDVPDTATVRAVDGLLSERFSDVTLVSQRNQTRTTDADRAGEPLLTDRQAEVAQVAYHSGFFEADRDVTGRDIASTLDISHTAFYDHVRRVEQKLFASLFEDRDGYVTVE